MVREHSSPAADQTKTDAHQRQQRRRAPGHESEHDQHLLEREAADRRHPPRGTLPGGPDRPRVPLPEYVGSQHSDDRPDRTGGSHTQPRYHSNALPHELVPSVLSQRLRGLARLSCPGWSGSQWSKSLLLKALFSGTKLG